MHKRLLYVPATKALLKYYKSQARSVAAVAVDVVVVGSVAVASSLDSPSPQQRPTTKRAAIAIAIAIYVDMVRNAQTSRHGIVSFAYYNNPADDPIHSQCA